MAVLVRMALLAIEVKVLAAPAQAAALARAFLFRGIAESPLRRVLVVLLALIRVSVVLAAQDKVALLVRSFPALAAPGVEEVSLLMGPAALAAAQVLALALVLVQARAAIVLVQEASVEVFKTNTIT